MYKLSENGVTLTRGDGSVLSIPNAEGNRHWREYQEWVAEGNTPAPQFTPEELAAKQLAEDKALAEKEKMEADKVLIDALEDILNGTPIATVKTMYADTLAKRANAKTVLESA